MATDVRETILLKAGSPNLEPEVITARLHEKEKQYRGCHGIFLFFLFALLARRSTVTRANYVAYGPNGLTSPKAGRRAHARPPMGGIT